MSKSWLSLTHSLLCMNYIERFVNRLRENFTKSFKYLINYIHTNTIGLHHNNIIISMHNYFILGLSNAPQTKRSIMYFNSPNGSNLAYESKKWLLCHNHVPVACTHYWAIRLCLIPIFFYSLEDSKGSTNKRESNHGSLQSVWVKFCLSVKKVIVMP